MTVTSNEFVQLGDEQTQNAPDNLSVKNDNNSFEVDHVTVRLWDRGK